MQLLALRHPLSTSGGFAAPAAGEFSDHPNTAFAYTREGGYPMNSFKGHHIVVQRRGPPDVLSWTPVQVRAPATGEVRVRVEAAGVSGFDLMIRGHWFFGFTKPPYTPGEDFVGIVDAIGPDVTSFTIGQRVTGWTFGQGGGYSEMIIRPAETLVPVPDGVESVTAAAIITNYLTASLVLEKTAKVHPGERLLIHGAAGGLGSALLQLGSLARFQMFGTGSDKSSDFIAENGAVPINYKAENFVRRIQDLTNDGVDVVIDVVGGPRQLWRSSRCLRRGGRLVMLGMASIYKSGAAIIPLSLLTAGTVALWPNGVSVPMSPSMLSFPAKNLDWYRDTLTDLLEKTAAGRLHPAIAAEVPMSEATRAHSMLEAGGLVGKVVLTNSK
ncbi:zinc-binding dehydrogenase [Tateyamaria omphalii]|uniref:zinc-binding dehydrogenase n=1 Tax=Tateyamaria omphalii TaxID=299262 RepID=UPI001C99565C|nr:zinc-binding dehydrogenase [Tateyamaria omphalii]MBY5931448.1 zinc-binding dehydrogenase [Tateyamaria omphalii]